MNIKYKILFLDHDDTSVNSTPTIHYPAHVAVMQRIRPNERIISIEEWFSKNFDPGIMHFLTDELGFSQDELDQEFKIWQQFTDSSTPKFFPGFLDLLQAYKNAGGIICVISHSEVQHIKRIYELHQFNPDAIYGWDNDPEKRKPAAWPILDFLKKKRITPEETLVVDDLKPGMEMARKAGSDFCAASWAHNVPLIRTYMQDNADYVADTIQDLEQILFSKKE